MEFKGFTLDKFQEESIQAIDNNHSVVVSAPTGSGKTLIADYIIFDSLKKKKKVIYTAPIKALSNQKYKEFTKDHGEENIGLMTGDIVINPEAPVLIMTTEIYRNMALINDPMINEISYVIFDEIHYINDIERGYVWEESIIFSKDHVRFLCLSATIPNAQEFASWIQNVKKHEVEVVKNEIRNVPLERKFFDAELGITTLRDIKEIANIPEMRGRKRRVGRQRTKAPSHVALIEEIRDKLPCFFFCFSRMKCQNNSLELKKKNLFPINTNIISKIREKLKNSPPEINHLTSTRALKETLPYGIGFHHAGLLPIIKELVEELFSEGLIKVLYTTETFAVGINMPAKTVCFEALRKFDGISFRYLNSKEYFQIAGRAGRRGIDKIGFSYAMIDRRDYDYHLYKKITDKDVEPIKSQFRLSTNTVLNLIKQHNQKEIDIILSMNFFTYQKYHNSTGKSNYIISRFNAIKKRLLSMDYITKENILTEKGEFASTIYADEILTGEIFATDFYKQLNEYQILLLIACLCYEPREKTQLYKEFASDFLNSLIKAVNQEVFLKKSKQFRQLKNVTTFIHPIYHGKNVFDVLELTNLSEGDVIRFYRQMLDKIGQIKKSTRDDGLRDILRSCKSVISDAMAEIDAI
ncbi:DEAD/DEAH box helicase [Candidatus Woesearchaeota archaeon]|jgi:superfamily II RNA helicase|nr:DEAD/DEAH box helicase [Candidatus Woesearchaeota archaeon]